MACVSLDVALNILGMAGICIPSFPPHTPVWEPSYEKACTLLTSEKRVLEILDKGYTIQFKPLLDAEQVVDSSRALR